MATCDTPPPLPEELLVKIFGYLNLNDVLECSLVNRHWYRATHTQGLHRRTWLRFRNQLDLTEGFPRVTAPHLWAFTKIHLQGIALNYNEGGSWVHMWSQIMPRLSSLVLEKVEASPNDLVAILKWGHNLREIGLINLRDVFMSGTILESKLERSCLNGVLTKVTTLDLAHNSFLSDVVFERMMECVPNLAHLSLRKCPILKTPMGPASEKKPNRSVLTFSVLLEFIRKQAQRLQSLDLVDTNLDGMRLQDIAEVDNLNLRTVKLAKNPISQEGVLHLVRCQKSLTSLDLDQCRRVFLDYPATSLQIFQEMEQIQDLNLRLLSIPKGLDTCLSKLHNLVRLDCTALDSSSKHLRKGLASSKSQKSLRSLNVSSFMSSPENFRAILSLFPNLEEFSAENCQEAMVDACLHTLLETCPKIKALNIGSCPRLSDLGFCGLAKADQVSFVGPIECMKLDGKIFLGTSAEGEVINDAARMSTARTLAETCHDWTDMAKLDKLSHLERLTLCNSDITDISIQRAFNFFCLREINLSKCLFISDTGFIMLSERNPSLEVVDISQTSITDSGLVGCVQALRRLVKLNVSQCRSLTSSGILQLAQFSTRLRNLDVSLCPKIKTETIDDLQSRLPRLRNVKIRGLEILECIQTFED
ncbi:F-box and leucine-rich repeat protein 13-like [Tigriopus californicus]|uniref:F-box and leucine-rich repeat protein 13-like n=1 Tax=Tigriopus californicus TaxID=6832 RepID=UPI0027D9D3E3|nr:F-box and leucine-rich repeat protein 13-like [Tigriopus californicus]